MKKPRIFKLPITQAGGEPLWGIHWGGNAIQITVTFKLAVKVYPMMLAYFLKHKDFEKAFSSL